MSKLGRAISLAGAAAAGYVQGDKMRKRDEEDKVDREIRLADAAYNQRQRARSESLDRDLATAGRQVEVNDGAATLNMGDGAKVYDDAGVAGSDFRQARRLGLADVGAPASTFAVNGQAYPDRTAADAAAAAANTPEAITLRQAQAYRAAGKPVEAMQLSTGALTQKRTEATYTDEQRARARRYQQEGLFDVAKASRSGDPQAIFDAANASGQFKLIGLPTVTPVKKKVTGVGEIETYDVLGQVAGPDGKPREIKINSHDFSASLLDYGKMLDVQAKGTNSESLANYRLGQLDNKAREVEMRGAIAEARAAAAQARSGEGAGRRERTEVRQLAGQTQTQLNALDRQLKANKEALAHPTRWMLTPTGEAEKKALAAETADIERERKDTAATLAELNDELRGARPRLSDARPLAPGAAPAPTAAPAPGARPTAAPRAAAAPPPPAKGATMDGYRFKGGNPADPKNWTKL